MKTNFVLNVDKRVQFIKMGFWKTEDWKADGQGEVPVKDE